MTAIGMETFSRGPPVLDSPDAERAATAINVGADPDDQPEVRIAGHIVSQWCRVVLFPVAHTGSVSTIGRNLADFVQRSGGTRANRISDCRPMAGPGICCTSDQNAPPFRFGVGYIANPHDRAMLVDAEFRDSLAEGILAAVKRLYLLGKNDRPTGTFTSPSCFRARDVRRAGPPGSLAGKFGPATDPVAVAAPPRAVARGPLRLRLSIPSPLSSSRRRRGKYRCGATTVNPAPLSNSRQPCIDRTSNPRAPLAPAPVRVSQRARRPGRRIRLCERMPPAHGHLVERVRSPRARASTGANRRSVPVRCPTTSAEPHPR